jgi:hypothetical protein
MEKIIKQEFTGLSINANYKATVLVGQYEVTLSIYGDLGVKENAIEFYCNDWEIDKVVYNGLEVDNMSKFRESMTNQGIDFYKRVREVVKDIDFDTNELDVKLIELL